MGSISGWCVEIVLNACSSDSDCDDGNACNGSETCVDTVCTPGTPVDCSDGNPCTVDNCPPADGSCFYTATNCDDGNGCTADFCDPATGCGHADHCVEFCNTGAITLNDGTSAAHGGQPLPVLHQRLAAPAPGVASVANIKLNGLTHTFPDDLDALLAGPTGASVVVLSDAGGGGDITNVNLVLTDGAAAVVPDGGPIVSGTFRHEQLRGNGRRLPGAGARASQRRGPVRLQRPECQRQLEPLLRGRRQHRRRHPGRRLVHQPARVLQHRRRVRRRRRLHGRRLRRGAVPATRPSAATTATAAPTTAATRCPAASTPTTPTPATTGTPAPPATPAVAAPASRAVRSAATTATPARPTAATRPPAASTPDHLRRRRRLHRRHLRRGLRLRLRPRSRDAAADAPEPNPHTRGYWKRLCQGPHSGDELTDGDAACVARLGEPLRRRRLRGRRLRGPQPERRPVRPGRDRAHEPGTQPVPPARVRGRLRSRPSTPTTPPSAQSTTTPTPTSVPAGTASWRSTWPARSTPDAPSASPACRSPSSPAAVRASTGRPWAAAPRR